MTGWQTHRFTELESDIYLQAHVTPPQTIPLIGAPKSMLVYDRLRDIRDLWLTDFLIDPSQLTKSDVDNIPEELFQVM